jgi:pimeloyl-ACP methyl ester carboxylesterase
MKQPQHRFHPVTSEDLKACMSHPPLTIVTALGPVEYADRGEGPAVLSAHGGPGGYDQGLGMCEVFRKAGYRVIAPSRPGYLGTPESPGKTAQEQADLLAALLDSLNLDKAIVVATCAGGPPTYQLAERHPQKVAALIEIDSISLRYSKETELDKTQEMIYLSKPGMWMMRFLLEHFPRTIVRSFIKTESDLRGADLEKRVRDIVGDKDKLTFVKYLFATMSTQYARRRQGLAIDFAIFDSFDKLPLGRITCPTLVVHGSADSDVPVAHGKYAARAIKHAELLWVEKGSHLGFWVAGDAYRAQQETLSWLDRVLAGQAPDPPTGGTAVSSPDTGTHDG